MNTSLKHVLAVQNGSGRNAEITAPENAIIRSNAHKSHDFGGGTPYDGLARCSVRGSNRENELWKPQMAQIMYILFGLLMSLAPIMADESTGEDHFVIVLVIIGILALIGLLCCACCCVQGNY